MRRGISYSPRMYRNSYLHFVAACLFVALPSGSAAQTAVPHSGDTSRNDALMSQLVTLRDAFVNQVKAEGFQPSLPPPAIVPDNPPSYGNYENDKNLLHIAAWTAAGAPEDQARFSRFGGNARHWTNQQSRHLRTACITGFLFTKWAIGGRHVSMSLGGNHYSEEYGANRIAAAFWRLKDPAFMERTAKKMASVYAAILIRSRRPISASILQR